jgi:hypothetical protein
MKKALFNSIMVSAKRTDVKVMCLKVQASLQSVDEVFKCASSYIFERLKGVGIMYNAKKSSEKRSFIAYEENIPTLKSEIKLMWPTFKLQDAKPEDFENYQKYSEFKIKDGNPIAYNNFRLFLKRVNF